MLRSDRGPILIPAFAIAEMTWFLEARMGSRVLSLFLEDIESGSYTLDFSEDDIARIRNLVDRYADSPLGFTDAAVIACGSDMAGAS
jgi:uncharacterized protein